MLLNRNLNVYTSSNPKLTRTLIENFTIDTYKKVFVNYLESQNLRDFFENITFKIFSKLEKTNTYGIQYDSLSLTFNIGNFLIRQQIFLYPERIFVGVFEVYYDISRNINFDKKKFVIITDISEFIKFLTYNNLI